MANFSITTPQVVDSLNYVLSGPSSIGNFTNGLTQEGFRYLTGTLSPPWSVPESAGPPSPGPQPYSYIPTDMKQLVSITDPGQKISLAYQIRPWWAYTLTTPSVIRFATSLIRWDTRDMVEFNPEFYFVNISSTSLSETAEESTAESLVYIGSTGLAIPTVIDIPGSVSTFAYQLMVSFEVASGDAVIDWIGVDSCSLTASVIKL